MRITENESESLLHEFTKFAFNSLTQILTIHIHIHKNSESYSQTKIIKIAVHN